MRFNLPTALDGALQKAIRLDSLILIAAGTALLGSWAFLEIADEVSEGSTRRFDDWAVRSLRREGEVGKPIGPRWLENDVRDLSALGGRPVLVLVTAAVVFYLWLSRSFHAMWLVLAAAVGGQTLTALLKLAFARPRPSIVPHLTSVDSSSFPSGHSMSAAVVYLTLGLLLARLTDRRRLRVFYLMIASIVTFLVGLSRIYLGVHYPTDVLAGWAAGAAWGSCCWLLAGYLQRRGRVESCADMTERAISRQNVRSLPLGARRENSSR